MRSLFAGAIALAGICGVASSTALAANPYGSSTLLPLPETSPQLYTPAEAVAASPYRATVARMHQEPMPSSPMPEGPSIACDAGAAADCGTCNSCGSCNWWFSFAALVMSRDNPNAFWTTFDTNLNTNQLMNTRDASPDWRWGGEITLGRWFGCDPCNRCGIAVSYFALDPISGFTSLRSPTNDLSTPINLNTQAGQFQIGARNAADYFDAAREHRISREDEIHNVEINFLNAHGGSGYGATVTWLAGVRFLRFDEGLVFGSVAGDAATVNAGGSEFGNNGGVDEAYLDIRTENNLVGFQIGAMLEWQTASRLGFFVTPKIGIYDNEIQARSRLYSGDGVTAFDIQSTESHFSFMAQLDVGLTWDWNDRVRLFGGYRAIAATGIALADNQIPAFIAAADEFADIDTNGNLILHGAFFGVEITF